MTGSPIDLGVGDHLALALVKSRDLADPTYQKWREVIRRFDKIRGRIDPVMNENANIDVLLRVVEAEQAQSVRQTGSINTDGRLRLQLQLSRVWLFGAYEAMRTLHEASLRTCKTPQHAAKCWQYHCLHCHLGHVKNDLGIIRVPMAKGDVARDVLKCPLPDHARNELLAMRGFQDGDAPGNEFLLPDEGIVDTNGTVLWANMDLRLGRKRAFSRLDYSNLILTFFNWGHDDHPAYPEL